MIPEWAWGEIPVGFKKLHPQRARMIVVRETLEPHLDAERFFDEAQSAEQTSPFHGRGQLCLYRFDNGEAALVRAYRHGGMLRHVTGHFFFTWPPRPFRELAVTEEVRRRGVPTPEVLGACVERIWGPFYRGWLLTRELTGGHDFWAALRNRLSTDPVAEPLIEAVARSLGTMHRRGVCHADLNLKNILVRHERSGIKSYIIDFDKARLFPGAVPPHRVEKNLRRLYRSVRKLDPERHWLPEKDWRLLLRCYREAEEK